MEEIEERLRLLTLSEMNNHNNNNNILNPPPLFSGKKELN